MEHRTESSRLAAVSIVAAVVVLLASNTVWAEKVYRWIDEEGNVHYTESLPPGYNDSGHDVLNESGIVIDENLKLTPELQPQEETEEQVKAAEADELPRDSSGLPRPKPLYTEAQKQAKMDNFLMLRYESEQEITDAMNVEIKQLNYDRRLLEGSRNSMNESYRGQIRVAANKQRSGQTVPADTSKQIEDLRKKLADNAMSLSALDQREQDIKATFQEQLDRYRYLVEKYAEENPG